MSSKHRNIKFSVELEVLGLTSLLDVKRKKEYLKAIPRNNSCLPNLIDLCDVKLFLTQLTFACSNTTIETLKKMQNMFK